MCDLGIEPYVGPNKRYKVEMEEDTARQKKQTQQGRKLNGVGRGQGLAMLWWLLDSHVIAVLTGCVKDLLNCLKIHPKRSVKP